MSAIETDSIHLSSPCPTIAAPSKRKAAMDWKGAMAEERAALQRIVVLLLALADLADLACGRSAAVRGFVVWILRRAEAVARDLVIGTPLPVSRDADFTSADAMRLARNFRELAGALARQAALAFAVCDEEDGCIEQMPPGVRRRLQIGGAGNFAKAIAVPISAHETFGFARLPDTS